MNLDIKAAKNKMLNEYLKDQGGVAFAQEYARLVDGFLVDLFEAAWKKSSMDNGLAMVALGGYGRGRLAPFSDLDLLFLVNKNGNQKDFSEVIEAILYPLWDQKLDVGHAMRTPSQCLALATEDFATLATQLDARFLAGDLAVFEDFKSRLRRWLGAGSRRRAFFRELKTSVELRHRKYGASPYLLEPNVKEGQGALRDIHAIGWTGKALYEERDLNRLVEMGFLTRARLDEIQAARDFVTDVRVRLHHLAEEKIDTLTFDLQVDVSSSLGFFDAGPLSGVEAFMKEYYIHVYNTKRTLDYFFSRVEANLTPRWLWRMTDRSRRVEKGLTIQRGQIELGGFPELRQRPSLMMRAFEVSAASGLPISQRSLELIRSSLDLVDDAFRANPSIAAVFLKGLTAIPPETAEVPKNLDAMQILHLLEAYFPEMSGVKAHVQHDAYHVYTVDVHLMVTVWELKKIAQGQYDPEDGGFDRAVMDQVQDRVLLFLAALFHDIGKGQGPNHALLGADMVGPICRRLGLTPEQTRIVQILVAEHLFLPDTAMRRDLSDEKLIVAGARRIGDLDRLNMLYLLTMADSRATGPGALNAWKSIMLRELYSKIYRILTRSDLAGKEMAQKTDDLLLQVEKALEGKMPPGEVDAHLEKMSAHYLSIMNAEQVVRHILLERELRPGQIIWEVEEKDEGFCEVTILTQDRPELLSRMAGVFTLHNINILGAQVFTRANNLALEIFQVGHPPDRVFADQAWQKVRKDAERVHTGHIALDYRLASKKPMLSSKPAVRGRPDRVEIDNDASDFYTIVEIYTYDRLGLLYDVTKTLFDLQLSIFLAKISTMVDQVVDVFYVRDHVGNKMTDEAQIQELKEALLFILKRGHRQ